ncbi:hypothetical protein [Luteolibacter sp. Populi]|uniref:hypothetical protein n=1 Tax=Luteolibacter sp. Populi TaxID=3230487 RepID=UPI003465AA23
MPDDHEPEAGNGNEWDLAPTAERPSIAPEDQDRFRGLLTELLFSAACAPVLAGTALCLQNLTRKPVVIYPGMPPPSPPPLWETALGQWLPFLLLILAFACLIWLITIPLRMAELKRGAA